MRRLSRIIFIVGLLCMVSSGQETQNVVLVPGDPPLTQQMVNQLSDFFQWALDISLTAPQQKSLEKSVVETWGTKNKSEIDSTLELLKLRDQLAQLTPADRDRARQQVQPEILKSLRSEPNDETARMLLSAYDAAHSQASVENQPSSGATPASLVGNWQSGSISSINFYNPTTGSWAAPSGTGMSYALSADGHYVYAGLLQTSMYGCTTTFFVYETGSWSVEGSTIHFSPTSSRAKSQDNCHQQFNYDRARELKKQSIPFSFKPNQYNGEQELCMTTNTGEICYRRAK